MARRRHVIATVWLTLSVSAAWPWPARAQDGGRAGEAPPFATWMLAGADAAHDRWRGSVRLGHLGDLDSGILITEAGWVAGAALVVQAGYVHLDPLAGDAAGISLVRAGGTWLPLRGRMTLDNRAFLERRSSRGTPAVLRGRDRLRLSWTLPQSRRLTAVGSAEAIVADGNGLVETRLQAGGVFAVRRLAVEVYALQRRLRSRRPVNGLGITLVYRIGG